MCLQLTTYIIMDKNESIEQVLEKMDKSVVFKEKKSALPSVLLVLLGIAIVVINAKFIYTEIGFVSPLLMMTGTIAVIIGLFSYVFRKNHFVLASNHQKLELLEVCFEASGRDKLIKLVESAKLSEIKLLTKSDSDGLKLRILTTNDANICFMQVTHYVPYEYVNLTAVKEFSSLEAKELVQMYK